MKRQRIIMLSLLATLTAFVAGSWPGLVQWWQSLTADRQFLYIVLLCCVVAGIVGHFKGINPLIILAGMIVLGIVAGLVRFMVIVCRS